MFANLTKDPMLTLFLASFYNRSFGEIKALF